MNATVDFTGQAVLVTGGGRGLGRTYCLALAARGANVVVSDLPGAEGEASYADVVSDEITSAGGRAIATTEAITTRDGATRIVQAATDTFGRLDGVICSAGSLRPGAFQDLDDDAFDLMMNVHLMGTVHVNRAAIDVMREQGYGRIVNTASSAGLFGMPAMSNYAAAKAATIALTSSLAAENDDFDITINSILPHASTSLDKRNPIPAELLKRDAAALDFKATFPERYTPDTVAGLALYLASTNCEVSGEAYSALGGRIALVSTAISQGWLDPHIAVPSPEDIALHLPEIRDMSHPAFPASVSDEHRLALGSLLDS